MRGSSHRVGKTRGSDPEILDIGIVGAGVSGVAAAIEAKKSGLRCAIYEASEVFSTVANFPKGKPIYTYPTDMTPEGELQFKSEVHPKEELLENLEATRKAAGGRSLRQDRAGRAKKAGSLCIMATRNGHKAGA